LRRESELLAQLGVAVLLEQEFVDNPTLESDPGDEVRASVKLLEGGEQLGGLVLVGEQADLGGQFHAADESRKLSISQGAPPPPEVGGLRAGCVRHDVEKNRRLLAGVRLECRLTKLGVKRANSGEGEK
jgi:hypothetical protein